MQRHVAKYATFFSFDAAHLKGNNKGILMMVSTRDLNGKLATSKFEGTNGKVTILAHSVVPSEDGENWLFFLKCFKEANPLTVAKFSISDRDKGLINAVREVFPELPHSKCLRHLSENFKKNFKQEMTDVLKCYALAYKPEDCTARLQV